MFANYLEETALTTSSDRGQNKLKITEICI